MKDYMMELADAKGVDFEQITQADMERDFMEKAQLAFSSDETPESELEKWKEYLPVKSYNEIKFYDSETGNSKFKVGSVLIDNGVFYLVK